MTVTRSKALFVGFNATKRKKNSKAASSNKRKKVDIDKTNNELDAIVENENYLDIVDFENTVEVAVNVNPILVDDDVIIPVAPVVTEDDIVAVSPIVEDAVIHVILLQMLGQYQYSRPSICNNKCSEVDLYFSRI